MNSGLNQLDARDRMLLGEIRFLFGLREANGLRTLPVICCLVRDGEYWLPAFLDHYRGLGVEEFFFLDNGSTDGTLEILVAERDVGVYSVDRSLFREFNPDLRRVLVRRVRPAGWTLGVDIDEFFDYPWSDQVSLTQLCRYFEQQNCNCMTTHMLDMFPDCGLKELSDLAGRDPRNTHVYYSLQALEINTYRCIGDMLSRHGADSLTTPTPDWKFFCNGYRHARFGSGIWLTKHALFNMDGRLTPYLHQHLHLFSRIGDVSAVLYHYKFSPGFRELVERAMVEKQYWGDSADYRHYNRAFLADQDIALKDGHARRLTHRAQLLEETFVEAPVDFPASIPSR